MKAFLLVAPLALGGWLAHATPQTDSPSTLVASNEAPAPSTPLVTNFASLDYFDQSCAGCHGPYGSFYGEAFGQSRDDAAMRQIVHEMAEGPAQAPITDKDLDVLTAWHRALRDDAPFVAVIKAEKADDGWILSGEASPDAQIELDGQKVPLNEHRWTAKLAQDAKGEITVKRGEKTATLNVWQAAFLPTMPKIEASKTDEKQP